jgi:hypothetical protein
MDDDDAANTSDDSDSCSGTDSEPTKYVPLAVAMIQVAQVTAP